MAGSSKLFNWFSLLLSVFRFELNLIITMPFDDKLAIFGTGNFGDSTIKVFLGFGMNGFVIS